MRGATLVRTPTRAPIIMSSRAVRAALNCRSAGKLLSQRQRGKGTTDFARPSSLFPSTCPDAAPQRRCVRAAAVGARGQQAGCVHSPGSQRASTEKVVRRRVACMRLHGVYAHAHASRGVTSCRLAPPPPLARMAGRCARRLTLRMLSFSQAVQPCFAHRLPLRSHTRLEPACALGALVAARWHTCCERG
jgi:hypothetical protein